MDTMMYSRTDTSDDTSDDADADTSDDTSDDAVLPHQMLPHQTTNDTPTRERTSSGELVSYTELAKRWGISRHAARRRLMRLKEIDGAPWLVLFFGDPMVNLDILHSLHPELARPEDIAGQVEELCDGLDAAMAQIAELNDFRRRAHAWLTRAGLIDIGAPKGDDD